MSPQLPWRRARLKGVCREITVGHVGPMATEYVDEGIPFLRSQNIQPFRIDWGDVKFITPEFNRRLKKSELGPGDLVVVRTGYPGTAAVIPEGAGKSNCADLVIIRSGDAVDARYLSCVFNSTWGKGAVGGSLVGVAQQHFNVAAARDMEILLPPLRLQRTIASILSAYDDLIENNLRRIKILEEMAQSLYKEWFVDFRFPGHENVKMVDSPLGMIPEGWTVESLNRVLFALESGSRPTGGASADGGVPSVGAENVIGLGRYDYSREKHVPREFFEKMKRGRVTSGDVLLYKDGANIGRMSMFRDGFPHHECCINEHVFILRADSRCPQLYLFFYLAWPDNTERIRQLNTNAAQPGINQKGLGELVMLLPDSVVHRFDEIVEPVVGEVFVLAKQNQRLRQTRDLLLPKLISGEIDVADLDIDVGEDAA